MSRFKLLLLLTIILLDVASTGVDPAAGRTVEVMTHEPCAFYP